MKTAISVPDEVFETSKRLARKLKVSRSAVFAMGIQKLAEQHDDDEITAKLNEYYGKNKAEPDAVVMQMAALSLPNDEW